MRLLWHGMLRDDDFMMCWKTVDEAHLVFLKASLFSFVKFGSSIPKFSLLEVGLSIFNQNVLTWD